MFNAHFFNGPKLDPGPSVGGIGLALGGVGSALYITCSFISLLPFGSAFGVAAAGAMFGFCFAMTGLALLAVALVVSGYSTLQEALTTKSEAPSSTPNPDMPTL